MKQALEDVLEPTVVAGSRRYHLKHDEDKDWYLYVLEGGEGDESTTFRVKQWKGGKDEPPYFFIRVSDKRKVWLLPEDDLPEEPAAPGTPVISKTMSNSSLLPEAEAPKTPSSVGGPTALPFTPVPQPIAPVSCLAVAQDVVASFTKHCQQLRLPVIDLPDEQAFLKPYLRMYDTIACDTEPPHDRMLARDKLLANMRHIYKSFTGINNKVLGSQSKVLATQKRQVALNEHTIKTLEDKEHAYLRRQEELLSLYNKRLEDLGRSTAFEATSYVHLEREVDELKAHYELQLEGYKQAEMVIQEEYINEFSDLNDRRKVLREKEDEIAEKTLTLQEAAEREIEVTRSSIEQDIMPVLDRVHQEQVPLPLEVLATDLTHKQQEFKKRTAESLDIQNKQLQRRFDLLTMTPSSVQSKHPAMAAEKVTSGINDFLQTEGTSVGLKSKHDQLNIADAKLQEAQSNYDKQVARLQEEGTMKLKQQATDYIKSASDVFNRSVADLVERAKQERTPAARRSISVSASPVQAVPMPELAQPVQRQPQTPVDILSVAKRNESVGLNASPAVSQPVYQTMMPKDVRTPSVRSASVGLSPVQPVLTPQLVQPVFRTNEESGQRHDKLHQRPEVPHPKAVPKERCFASPLPPDAPTSPLMPHPVELSEDLISPPRRREAIQQESPVTTPPRPLDTENRSAVPTPVLVQAVSIVQTDDTYPPAAVTPTAVHRSIDTAVSPAKDALWREAVMREVAEREAAVAEREAAVSAERQAVREKELILHKLALELDEKRRVLEDSKGNAARALDDKDESLKMVLKDVMTYKERELEMQRLLREFRDKCEEYEVTTNELNNELEMLEGRYRHVVLERDSASNEARKLLSINKDLNADMETGQQLTAKEMRQNREMVATKLQTLQKEGENTENRYKGEVQALKAELKTAKDKAKELELEVVRAKNKVRDTEGVADRRKHAADLLQRELDSTKDHHRNEKERLIEDYKTHIRSISGDEKAQQQTRHDVGALTRENTALKAQIAELMNNQTQKGNAKDNVIERLQQERDRLGGVCEVLKQEIEAMRMHHMQQEGRILLEFDRLKNRTPVATPPAYKRDQSPTPTPTPTPLSTPYHSKPPYRRSLSADPSAAQLPIPPPQYAALTTSPVGFTESLSRRSNSRSPSIRL